MMKVTLTNEILKYITEIDRNRYKVSSVKMSRTAANRLRKNSKKRVPMPRIKSKEILSPRSRPMRSSNGMRESIS